jgi:carboxyl-terminal processing protease
VNEEDRYTTPSGKVVYGGGGIVPDIFIPLDTSDYSTFHNRLISNGLLREFALELAAEGKQELGSFSGVDEFKKKFQVSDSELERLITLGRERGIKATPEQVNHAKRGILRNLRALVARSVWNGDGYHSVMNETDSAVLEALSVLEGN